MSSCSSLDFAWCNAKHRWCSIDIPLMLIFRMWQQVYHLPFLCLRQPIHSPWNDLTIPPIDHRICKTVNCWQSVDPNFDHMETAFEHLITVRNDSYTRYCHSILYLYVLSFVSRRFITSPCLVRSYPCYLCDWQCVPITFLRFQRAIYGT